jgi:hypothetical protein
MTSGGTGKPGYSVVAMSLWFCCTARDNSSAEAPRAVAGLSGSMLHSLICTHKRDERGLARLHMYLHIIAAAHIVQSCFQNNLVQVN